MEKESKKVALGKLLEEENIKIGIWMREIERFELTKELILRELKKLEEEYKKRSEGKEVKGIVNKRKEKSKKEVE